MSIYKNMYAQKLFDILAPIIGELMSKGAIRSQCNKLGINEETIQKKDLLQIAEGIRKAMMLFVGTDGARQISDRIIKL
ncbi:MAG: hypothetical protein KA807_00500 [Prolixibacteraceae bacterium]|nr:hypothetical protein [Prolixibacteraceae bacterium]